MRTRALLAGLALCATLAGPAPAQEPPTRPPTAEQNYARLLLVATEAKLAEGKISVASPVGKALLGKANGEEVQVTAPAGIVRFRIKEITT